MIRRKSAPCAALAASGPSPAPGATVPDRHRTARRPHSRDTTRTLRKTFPHRRADDASRMRSLAGRTAVLRHRNENLQDTLTSAFRNAETTGSAMRSSLSAYGVCVSTRVTDHSIIAGRNASDIQCRKVPETSMDKAQRSMSPRERFMAAIVSGRAAAENSKRSLG